MQNTKSEGLNDYELSPTSHLPLKDNDETADPESNSEMVDNSKKRNWKGIFLSLLVILFICGMICIAIVLTRKEKVDYGKFLELSDLKWIGRYSIVGNTKFSDDFLIYQNEKKSYLLYDLKNNNETLLTRGNKFSKSGFRLAGISPGREFGLLRGKVVRIYRRSFYAIFKIIRFNKNYNPEILPDLALQKLQYASFTNTKSGFIYVNNNRIYYRKNIFFGKKDKQIELTKGLSQKTGIKYGIADWLYEEEILHDSKALWINQDDSLVAFISFNDSMVAQYPLTNIGKFDIVMPSINKIRYPIAGGNATISKNPTVEVFLAKTSVSTTPIRVPKMKILLKTDHYFLFARWYTKDALIIGWTDRLYQNFWISLSKINNPFKISKTFKIFHLKCETGWLNLLKNRKNEPIMDPKNNRIILLAEKYRMINSKQDGYRNILMIKLDLQNDKSNYQWIITPNFDLKDIIHFNNSNNILYYTGVKADDPKVLHLYRDTIPDNEPISEPTCLTCDLSCKYNKFKIDSSGNFAVHTCLGPDLPYRNLISFSSGNKIKVIKKIQKSEKYEQKIKKYAMPNIKFTKVSIKTSNSDTISLEARIRIPVNLNPDKDRKYPILLKVYSGPGSQLITKMYKRDFLDIFCSKYGMVIVEFDARGTAGRGRAWETSIYKNLGNIEISDQLEAFKKFIQSNSYIDINKSAVFGWSYGGFTTSHMLFANENDFLRCGVAVAPVTSFHYYDTAYTERYMGYFKDNQPEYQQTNVSNRLNYYKNRGDINLFLIHGLFDDNVHPEQTEYLIRHLIRLKLKFTSMFYPNAKHNMNGVGYSTDMYKRISNFLTDCMHVSR